jgi:DNA-damage-inducible protein J
MANTTNFSVRMDSDIKKQCEALYGELGMNLTTAINVFFCGSRFGLAVFRST